MEQEQIKMVSINFEVDYDSAVKVCRMLSNLYGDKRFEFIDQFPGHNPMRDPDVFALKAFSDGIRECIKSHVETYVCGIEKEITI